MGNISVVIRTHDGVETWGAWDHADKARYHAIDTSINGRDVEWVKVVEAFDGDSAAGRNTVLSHYEHGVSVNPRRGWAWPPVFAPAHFTYPPNKRRHHESGSERGSLVIGVEGIPARMGPESS